MVYIMRMARRKDHTRDELKQLAIEHGHELITEKGFKAFSIREVSKNMGYTVGTLYQIFKNSTDLIIHINALTLKSMNEYLQLGIKKAKNQKLALALSYYNFAIENRNLWLALFENILPIDTKLPDWYEAEMNKAFSIAHDLFENDNIKQEAQLFWASVHGVTILAITQKLHSTKSSSAEKLIKQLVEKF